MYSSFFKLPIQTLHTVHFQVNFALSESSSLFRVRQNGKMFMKNLFGFLICNEYHILKMRHDQITYILRIKLVSINFFSFVRLCV